MQDLKPGPRGGCLQARNDTRSAWALAAARDSSKEQRKIKKGALEGSNCTEKGQGRETKQSDRAERAEPDPRSATNRHVSIRAVPAAAF